jgi:hypothetical protein
MIFKVLIKHIIAKDEEKLFIKEVFEIGIIFPGAALHCIW